MEDEMNSQRRSSRTPFWCGIYILLSGLLSVLAGPAHAQTQEPTKLPGSWNPVGSGARALGMGGAFIAVADDAGAAGGAILTGKRTFISELTLEVQENKALLSMI